MKARFLYLLNLIALPLFAQDGNGFIKQGNEHYGEGKMEEAVKAYDKAMDGPQKYIALMNKGNALYRLKKQDDALKTYDQVATSLQTSNDLRSGAYYNSGVVYSNMNKLEQSIEAYKNALRFNSNDTKARENLQKALLEKKKQSGGGGGQDKKEDENKKPDKSRLNPRQAQNQLDKLENKEKNTQQRISEDKSQYGTSAEKDW